MKHKKRAASAKPDGISIGVCLGFLSALLFENPLLILAGIFLGTLYDGAQRKKV